MNAEAAVVPALGEAEEMVTSANLSMFQEQRFFFFCLVPF